MKKKVVGAWHRYQWVDANAPFERHVWRCPSVKCHLLTSFWERCCIFFLLVKRVPMKDEWFVTCRHFFNSFFSLSSPKSTYWSSLFCLFQSQSLFFLFLFFSWFFYKNFVCFEFSSSIIICHVFFFFNSVFILLISNLYPWHFC
jgi:hypothetical protein